MRQPPAPRSAKLILPRRDARQRSHPTHRDLTPHPHADPKGRPMPTAIEMPRLSDTMEEGTLVTWHVKVGDTVSAGDLLADVETDKATMELQAFEDGTIAKLAIGEGSTVPVGQAILILAADGEDLDEAAKMDVATAAATTGSSDAPAPPDTAPPVPETPAAAPPAPAGRVRISPLAAKLAEQHSIDVNTLQGSGPDGRIIKRDVLRAADPTHQSPQKPQDSAGSAPPKSPAPAPPPPVMPATLESKTIPVSGMRKTIAKRLVESKTTVPHFQVSVAVEMDALMALRGTINAQLEPQGIKLSINDFITRGVALAAAQHPAINSSWTGDAIQQHGSVNVGTAIALPEDKGGGLLVAVVRDVQSKGLRQISEEIKALAGKAKGKGLPPEDMADSTITISNLGMPQYGVTQFSAIVNPPNAAIIAVGAAIKQPVVRDNELAIGHVMNVTLSGDHRAIDGAQAAEYLSTLRGLLQNPAALLV
ncbi:MAG: dihydrolipoamide acetyltransferase family protein [Planctomycetota bacterium]